ncbi:hypothetical protein FLJC2902T_31600 [Flavobacterium limnosediminis JC2902]|uniref:Uncharacterized protein n=1 Tax=Flavobacterium limnosediminis JC2902 TaxID=1341181 RepID=V6SLG1_9FLAO|nr:hypothetical protein [Flavobacterium limnosediminis]ESU25220.1 hypothetical protein FLJC2902T_31600 [Flavobacterium limnosediminis JC2902]
MKKIIVNKKVVIESVTKMVADKVAVREFLKGKTTIETLKQKGITLAKPI